MTEDEIVAAAGELAKRLPSPGVRIGIGDDGASLEVPPDRELVVCLDTLNEGVHFTPEVKAGDLGYKALAVNLSDLAAMGAVPAWAMLSLSVRNPTTAWIGDFLSGFGELADRHRLALLGGDTTRGPLAVSITVGGLLPRGQALRRRRSQPGECLWVSGTLGDAALARSGVSDDALDQRLNRPVPRIELGCALRGLATSCIDLSDGLLRDLPRLLPDGCGAQINVDQLPLSDAFRRRAEGRPGISLALAGGDDYELCFTVAEAHSQRVRDLSADLDLPLHCIGTVTDEARINYLTGLGEAVELEDVASFEHF